MSIKKIFILCIFTISVLSNVYFVYLYYKELRCTNTLRKELKFVPYMLSLEQIDNIQLYFQKPEIFKAKIYGETAAFFESIEKTNKNIYSKISCTNWSKNSKNIFYSFLKKNKDLYKLDDNHYQDILNGINFMDTLCNKKKTKNVPSNTYNPPFSNTQSQPTLK